ncbi:hypothetical protein BLOT_000411 [Blomia tropicalis]|nr:hypothetical protein BLOT_000411 [Blomia tropicalis]
MATLDDKLLGEKTHYYCSSSEDEGDDECEARKSSKPTSTVSKQPDTNFLGRSKIASDFRRKWDETVNTGPKGVIKDFQRYKQFENEQRESQEKEKLELMKKLSLSCRSYLDDKIEQNLNSEDGLIDDDENDPFMKEYIAKRMREMLERYQQREAKKLFGELQYLNDGESFLAITDDKDLKNVLIITHVYNRKIAECKMMNSCLDKLAKKYQHVKFCCLDASIAGMSYEFVKYGVPALLVYKNGDLVGNFVSLGEEFGKEFDDNDVEDFLVENNILVSSQLISSISYNSNLSSISPNNMGSKKN